MANFLAQKVIDGVYTYAFIIGKRPDLKSGIDVYLISKGREDIVES